MTLIVAVNGPKSVWLLADRRLSSGGRPVKEDACKIMFLETRDGAAILGYAGLGATPRRTEPSEWMSAVLRTRIFPLEHSLRALAEAMKKQFPRHMMLGVPAHNTIIPAFIDGEARLYSIDMIVSPNRKNYSFRWARHTVGMTVKPPRIAFAGTGGMYLLQQKDKKWIRGLFRRVKAHDNSQASADLVTDYLATLNYEVHQHIRDQSVGSRCIVAWRYKVGGGGFSSYTGVSQDVVSECLPTIAGGIDVKALVALPHLAGMFERFEARQAGQSVREPNDDEINAELSSLPNTPDEILR